jgi:hypothetical protein
MSLRIEKNIPYRRDFKGELSEIAMAMVQGDSVFAQTNHIRSRLMYAINKAGAAAVSLKEGDGYRVWRMAPRANN